MAGTGVHLPRLSCLASLAISRQLTRSV
jgi:hypothetical protein